MFKEKIVKKVEDYLKPFIKEEELKVNLEFTTDINKGDYFLNSAFIYSKKIGKKPLDLAVEIAEEIKSLNLPEIQEVQVASPSFINIFLSKSFFKDNLTKIVEEGKDYGKNNYFTGKKIIIEYTDPNIFKPFHIGHLMSNAIGESISRFLEFGGAFVKRTSYSGDTGLHIAKALWGMKRMTKEIPQEIDTPDKKSEFLGRAYVLGSKFYEESEEIKKEIDNLNVLISEKKESEEFKEFYKKGKKWSLEHFEKIYEILGTKFDKLYFETQTAPKGVEIVKGNIGRVFEESEGAIIYRGEKKGLHTRVFINSRGIPLYEAKELALPSIKYNDFSYDLSIVITAEEQKDYFQVVLSALEEIDPNLKKKTIHITHGMMRVGNKKMSSRKGDVVTGEKLLTLTIDEVGKIMKDRDFKEIEKKEIEKKVAVGAIKYAILKQDTRKNISYEQEKALSFEGDSGPYLQYALTRAKSIISKINSSELNNLDINLNTNRKIYEIERVMVKFPFFISRSIQEFSPHYTTTYLTNLASVFNSFYTKERILDDKSDERIYKLALILSFINIMEKGLDLLGISSIDKM